MLAGLDTNVLIDVRVLGMERALELVLAGEGWTTVFVDQEFVDPREDKFRIANVFPFIEVDPVDGRLLARIERDQRAIVGHEKAEEGGAAGEASLVHVARETRPGSIVLSNDTHALKLGQRHGVRVRGTLYVMHLAFVTELLTANDAWANYRLLKQQGRRPPSLTKNQLNTYLATGRDPRGS